MIVYSNRILLVNFSPSLTYFLRVKYRIVHYYRYSIFPSLNFNAVVMVWFWYSLATNSCNNIARKNNKVSVLIPERTSLRCLWIQWPNPSNNSLQRTTLQLELHLSKLIFHTVVMNWFWYSLATNPCNNIVQKNNKVSVLIPERTSLRCLWI